MEKVIRVSVDVFMCQRQYTIYYETGEGEIVTVSLEPGVWGKDAIVDALIRSRYTQDSVEAIINNKLMAIGDFMDELKNGGIMDAIKLLKEMAADETYTKFQSWRKVCKRMADEALVEYPVA